MLEKVYHIAYVTDDFEKAIALYEGVFKGTVRVRGSLPDGTLVAMIQGGDFEVEIIQPVDMSRMEGKTGLVLDHIAYFVADLDEAIKELETKGMTFSGGVRTVPSTGYRTAFMDSAGAMGATIQLFSK